MAVLKKVKSNIKFRVPAGKATPAPPVGSTLGAHGVNMMEFISAFNERTRDMGDVLVNVKVAIYEDRTFTFTTKGATSAQQIRKIAGLTKGSGVPNKTKVGSVTRAQLVELAATKMVDMNAHDVDAADKVLAGTARSMGIEVND